MKRITLILLTLGLSSCVVVDDLSSSLPTSSTSELTSTSSLSTSSSASLTTTSLTTTSENTLTSSSSTTSTTSLVTSSSSSTPSSATNATLDAIWATAMGGITPSNFYGVTETLPTNLSQVKITHVIAVYRQDQTLYGYAYEARVDGNAGPNSIRFRIGIKASTYAAFINVSNSEHTGFGRAIITALVNQLAGKPATYQEALQIMLTANASASSSTETLNGLRPAIEALTLHYLSKIA